MSREEVIGIVKIAIAQVYLIRAPVYAAGMTDPAIYDQILQEDSNRGEKVRLIKE